MHPPPPQLNTTAAFWTNDVGLSSLPDGVAVLLENVDGPLGGILPGLLLGGPRLLAHLVVLNPHIARLQSVHRDCCRGSYSVKIKPKVLSRYSFFIQDKQKKVR